MSLKSKLATLIWFLKRPSFYAQLIYLFYQRVFPHPKEATRSESTLWCAKNSIASSEAIRLITGSDSITPLTKLFPEFFKQAEDIVSSIDTKMGGEADLNLLYHLTEHLKAMTVIESGVAYGWSSAAILLSLRTRPGSMLHSTDMPYPKMNNEEFVGSVIPAGLRSTWNLIRLPDRSALPPLLEEIKRFDLCHYDSDKSYRGRMWAYPLLWKHLRKGGIFISDDINDNLAFRDFAETMNSNPIIVYYEPEKKFIGILIKDA